MKDKIQNIFTKIIAIIFLLAILFLLAVFLFPDFADQYGNQELNTQIRHFKNQSLEISPPDGNLNLSF